MTTYCWRCPVCGLKAESTGLKPGFQHSHLSVADYPIDFIRDYRAEAVYMKSVK